MKRIITVCVLLTLLVGCSATYIAKPVADITVIRGNVDLDDYTPLGLVEAERMNFYFLGIEAAKIASASNKDQLDDVVNTMLIKAARDLGANAIINLESDVSVPHFPLCFYKAEAKGIAVKLKK